MPPSLQRFLQNVLHRLRADPLGIFVRVLKARILARRRVEFGELARLEDFEVHVDVEFDPLLHDMSEAP